jgi:methionine aminopeptidase
MAIHLKTPEEVVHMRVAGKLAGEVLDFVAPRVKPGVTTGELDRLCHQLIVEEQKAVPAPTLRPGTNLSRNPSALPSITKSATESRASGCSKGAIS